MFSWPSRKASPRMLNAVGFVVSTSMLSVVFCVKKVSCETLICPPFLSVMVEVPCAAVVSAPVIFHAEFCPTMFVIAIADCCMAMRVCFEFIVAPSLILIVALPAYAWSMRSVMLSVVFWFARLRLAFAVSFCASVMCAVLMVAAVFMFRVAVPWFASVMS